MKQSYLKKQNDPNVGIRCFLIAIYIVLSFFEYYTLMAFGSITKYYIFLVIVMILLTSNHLRIHYYHYTIVGWLAYKFLSLIWTPNYTVFGMHAISEVGFVLLLVGITSLEESEATLKVLQYSSWICSFVLGVLSLFFSRAYEGEQNRQVLSLFGRQLDPNNVAAFLLFGIAISLYAILYEKKHKVLHLVIVITNSYATLMTGSRAGLLAIAVIILVFVVTLYNPDSFKRSYNRILLIAVIILAAGIIIFNFLPEDISNRLFVFEDYEGGSNRDVMWQHGLNILANPIYLLMGIGWGGYRADGGYLSLHNTFLSILCDTGIFGFALLFIPIFLLLRKMLKEKNVLPFAVFIASMVPSFFIEAVNKRFFWNAIIYVLVAYNCSLKKQPVEEEQNTNK